FLMEPATRRRIIAATGIAATTAFLILRAVNVYGDPAPWSTQSSLPYTAMSFLNTTKYPPSLAFLLMTLGPAILALPYIVRLPPKLLNPFLVFGRVPLFYFVLHFYAAHAIEVVLASVRYGSRSLDFLLYPLPSVGGPRQMFPAGFGYSLWLV